MPRTSRIYSNSQIYHVILRGIDKQMIFCDEEDKKIFLNQLLITQNKYEYENYAYCLMSNHVHLVLKIENEFLSKTIQSLEIRYSKYFNEKYERVGHFFENRFKSKVVEDKRYFMDLCRYVHRNPEKANIDSTDNYKWSSYHEYVGNEKIINKKTLLSYYEDGLNQFIDHTLECNEYKDDEVYAEYEILERIPDDELRKFIIKRLKVDSIEEVAKMNTKLQRQAIESIKTIRGTNINQLARVTRISRGIIRSVCKRKD